MDTVTKTSTGKVDHPLPPPTPDMVMATEDMINQLGPDSYQPIPGFDPIVMRDIPQAAKYSDGKVSAVVTKANPKAKWVGSVWHMHHLDCQIFFTLQGTSDFEFEGIGEVHLGPGTIMYQPPMNRHREMGFSTDNETLLLTLPTRFKTTMFPYNAEDGTYSEITMDTDDPEIGQYGDVEVAED